MNITIVNAHWNNRGDEAAHRALWNTLLKKYPGAKFTVLFKDKNEITWFPDDLDFAYEAAQFNASPLEIWIAVLTRGRMGKNPTLKNSVKILKDADLIIYSPGGSVINDRFFWRKQMEYLMPFICAKFYNIPVFVAAPSMGPYEQKFWRNLVRKYFLNAAKVLCVREDISQKYLADIGVTENVEVTIDTAFLDEIDTAAAQKQLQPYADLHDFLNTHDKVIGMTLSDFRWHVAYHKDTDLSACIQDSFQKFIKHLTTQGYGVLLIPQLFGNQDDTSYLQNFMGEGVFMMSNTPDTYAQQYIISRLYAVIGMRYHPNIFAAKMGAPFIAVEYEEKMRGFLELADLSAYGLPLADLSFDSLRDKFEILETRHKDIQNHLKDSLSAWRSRAQRTIDLLPDPQDIKSS